MPTLPFLFNIVLGILLMKEVEDNTDGTIYCAYGLEELILSK